MLRLLRPLLVPIAVALGAGPVHAQDEKKPAAEPEKPESTITRAPGVPPDPTIIEDIFECIAEGLPQGWKKSWIAIRQVGGTANATTRKFEATFLYATDPADKKGMPFKPCGAERVRYGMVSLNDYLTPSQRRWTGATLTFTSDGNFNIDYDYTSLKPEAKPAAKPSPKKSVAKPAVKPAAK